MRLYGTHADIPALDERVAAKLIARKEHPALDGVRLYNYTPVAQYDRAWDEHVMQARGLVVDGEGRIIARPLPKFFNHDELDEALPWDQPFNVTTKMDGSMFFASRLADGDILSGTRGSFDSTQARWGRHLLGNPLWLEHGITYVFELIHPQNRIVVDYGDRLELVLLAMVETATGAERSLNHAPAGVPVVEHHAFAGIADGAALLSLEQPNMEGFVVRFHDGLRVKVKFAEYKRLHRIITGVSTKTIWETLRDGHDIAELLERVPDEFNAFVRATVADLTERFDAKEARGLELVASANHLKTRKEQAAVISRDREHSAIAFAMLDQKDHAARIWRMIEPEWRQPFASRDAA